MTFTASTSQESTGHPRTSTDTSRTPAPADAGYTRRIQEILQSLGIPEDYACSRGLTVQPEADLLVPARVLPDGREIRLIPEVAEDWKAMVQAAARDNVTLLLISGFRSVDYQHQIIHRKLSRGESLDQILQVNAAPGYSQHHTGRAVDIGTPGCPPLEEDFENTTAFRWLQENAAGFGFHLSYPRFNLHRIVYEPWHWLHRS